MSNSNKLVIRQIEPEFDSQRLADLGTSFSTEYIYRLDLRGMSVKIRKERLKSPLSKSYPFNFIRQDMDEADLAVVAETGVRIVGLATVKYEEWNNRAVLTGIFVAPEIKRAGVGSALLEAAVDYAKIKGARCLFVETQNVNYPAIQFYRKMNFEFCGFDTALYNSISNEIAFYFCKNLLDENTRNTAPDAS